MPRKFASVPFYRRLVLVYNDYDFFENSRLMTKGFLFSSSLEMYAYRKVGVLYYDPLVPADDVTFDGKEVVILSRGLNREYATMKSEDYRRIDLSSIDEPLYRLYLYRMIIKSRSYKTSLAVVPYARFFLSVIIAAKRESGYSNPDLHYLNDAEALAIKISISKHYTKVSSYNIALASARIFFQWCSDMGYMTFGSTFFKLLKGDPQPKIGNARKIPDNDLSKIFNSMFDILHENPDNVMYHLCYYACLLQLQTHFRIGQICMLRDDCIHRDSIKQNRYCMDVITKTTNGVSKPVVITESTRMLLKEIATYTSELREQCSIDSLKHNLFVYSKNTGIVCLNRDNVKRFLNIACDRAGVRTYSPSNLRDTYMSKAWSFSMKEGLSRLETSVLTGHSNLDTTEKHYRDIDAKELLKVSMGVVINDYEPQVPDIKQRIVDKNNVCVGNDSFVEGVGWCQVPASQQVGACISCLLCPHFVTTTDQLKSFIRLADEIDKELLTTVREHDRQDLLAKKELVAMYILNILERLK